MGFKSIREKISDQKKKLSGKDKSDDVLTPFYVEMLIKQTRLPESKIREIFEKYFSKAPKNELNKEEFIKAYSSLMSPECRQRAGEFASYVFNVFDKDGNGKITFEEFLISYAISTNGDKREKLNLVFDIYDIDGNGELNMDEIHEVSNAVMSFLGMHVQVDLDFLMDIDKDGDKTVTREEFVNSLMKNEFLDTVMVPFH